MCGKENKKTNKTKCGNVDTYILTKSGKNCNHKKIQMFTMWKRVLKSGKEKICLIFENMI